MFYFKKLPQHVIFCDTLYIQKYFLKSSRYCPKRNIFYLSLTSTALAIDGGYQLSCIKIILSETANLHVSYRLF